VVSISGQGVGDGVIAGPVEAFSDVPSCNVIRENFRIDISIFAGFGLARFERVVIVLA
jgi:hypothetical protein